MLPRVPVCSVRCALSGGGRDAGTRVGGASAGARASVCAHTWRTASSDSPHEAQLRGIAAHTLCCLRSAVRATEPLLLAAALVLLEGRVGCELEGVQIRWEKSPPGLRERLHDCFVARWPTARTGALAVLTLSARGLTSKVLKDGDLHPQSQRKITTPPRLCIKSRLALFYFVFFRDCHRPPSPAPGRRPSSAGCGRRAGAGGAEASLASLTPNEAPQGPPRLLRPIRRGVLGSSPGE